MGNNKKINNRQTKNYLNSKRFHIECEFIDSNHWITSFPGTSKN